MFSLRTYHSIARAVLTKRSPYYVQFYINGDCNLKCRQCNIVETNSRVSAMSIEQINDVAANLARIGAGIVLLTGGEPFLRDDLPQIVEAFVRRGLNVRLQTAGTQVATEDKLRACYDAGARDINVSLDSLDLDTFDYINAVPGSARNAVNTIERISRIFRSRSAILSFGTVLSRFNYREIPAIAEFARRIGWYVSLVPVHIASSDRPRGFQSFDELFRFDSRHHAELESLIDRLAQMRRDGWPIFDSERFLRSTLSFLKGEGPTWRHNGVCDSPNLYFAIRPNGDFSTCCDYTLRNAPSTYSKEFVDQYRSRDIERRTDVRDIVARCEGCHYGSYPEVTLSVRDPLVFLERASIAIRSGKGRLKRAVVTEDFLGELRRVQADMPDVYPLARWRDPAINDLVAQWSDRDGRRELLRLDGRAREIQNRVRGSGPEPAFEPGNAVPLHVHRHAN